MNSFTRLGGLKSDITPEWPEHVKAFLKRVPKTLADCEALLLRNRIFIERLRGIGYVGKEDATNWSLTGVVARASGVIRDLRKDDPYLCFEQNWDGQGSSPVDFKVPVSDMGDCYARFVLRLEEIKQSLHIIGQLVDNIPPGPVNVASDEKINLPDKTEVWGSIEGLIHHFETGDVEPRLESAGGRGIRGGREPQRRAGTAGCEQRRAGGVPGAMAAAEFHQLPVLRRPDPGASDLGCGRGAGEFEHHRGGVGSVEEG